MNKTNETSAEGKKAISWASLGCRSLFLAKMTDPSRVASPRATIVSQGIRSSQNDLIDLSDSIECLTLPYVLSSSELSYLYLWYVSLLSSLFSAASWFCVSFCLYSYFEYPYIIYGGKNNGGILVKRKEEKEEVKTKRNETNEASIQARFWSTYGLVSGLVYDGYDTRLLLRVVL